MTKATLEGITIVLDTVSFYLVTPEFLGEEKLNSIRNLVERPLKWLTEAFDKMIDLLDDARTLASIFFTKLSTTGQFLTLKQLRTEQLQTELRAGQPLSFPTQQIGFQKPTSSLGYRYGASKLKDITGAVLCDIILAVVISNADSIYNVLTTLYVVAIASPVVIVPFIFFFIFLNLAALCHLIQLPINGALFMVQKSKIKGLAFLLGATLFFIGRGISMYALYVDH